MSARSITHATFTLHRVYPFSPARVFFALSDPEAKGRWFGGPEEWTPEQHQMDFRIGGRETSSGGPVGGTVHTYNAIYQDIVPDERIIYSYDMTLDAVRISVSIATIELRPEGQGTRLTLTEIGAFLDGFDDAGGREHGMGELLDALGESLAAQSQQ